MANIDYKKCRKIGDSIYIQFTNGESWLIPLDDIVADIEGGTKIYPIETESQEEQRQIAKLEIMLDVCKRDKDALRYQLEEAKQKSRPTPLAPDEGGECRCNAEHAHMTYIAHEEGCPARLRR